VKKVLSLFLFLLLTFLSALPSIAQMPDNFYYSEVLPFWKDPSTVTESSFLDGLWCYEILDTASKSFTLPTVRQSGEDGDFYAAPQDPACRILEGVCLYPGTGSAPVLTFVAPKDGTLTYTVFGYMRREGSDRAPSLSLYLDSDMICYEENLFDGKNTTPGSKLDVREIEVRAGQKLRLVVEGDGSGNCYCISGAPSVIYTPDVAPLQNVSVTHFSQDSCHIQWPVVGSAVRYEIQLNGEVMNDPGYNKTYYAFRNLQADTRYTVTVLAYNQAGDVVADSGEVFFRTAPAEETPEVLPAPENLRLLLLFPESFYLAWDPVATDIRFNLYLNGNLFYEAYDGNPSFVYVPCEPGQTYRVTVTCLSADGESAPSEVLTVTAPLLTDSSGPETSATDVPSADGSVSGAPAPSGAASGSWFPMVLMGAGACVILALGLILLLRKK